MWGPFTNTGTFYLNVGINNTHRQFEYLLTQGVCLKYYLLHTPYPFLDFFFRFLLFLLVGFWNKRNDIMFDEKQIAIN